MKFMRTIIAALLVSLFFRCEAQSVPPLPPAAMPAAPVANTNTFSLELAWTASPSPNVVGYNVYEGTASEVYTNEIFLGNVTNATVSNLVHGVRYFFAVASMNASGEQSTLSQELSFSGWQDQSWIVLGQALGSAATTWTNVWASQASNGCGFYRLGWQMRRVALP